MGEDVFSTDASNITLEACAWIAQLETGELSAADQDAFREWIARSPQHASEIKQQAHMSCELNVLSGMAQSINKASAEHRGTVQRGKPRNTFAFGKAIAALFVAAFALILFMDRTNTSIETTFYATELGQHEKITLTDGSVVQLNTDSQIEVLFENNNRRVRLLRGEAFFDVTPNAERPFWVYANDQYVRVVGTAFLVSLLDTDFNLLVTEGRVELARTPSLTNLQIPTDSQSSIDQNTDGQLSTEPIALKAGQSIRVSGARQTIAVQAVSEREQLRELSWQEGLHDFSNARLEDVVKELSRYSSMKIEITDPELRDLRFGGVFRIGDIQPLFDALQTAYGINVSNFDSDTVRLSLTN